MPDALARTKSGWGASRANLIAQLTVERLTGEPSQSFDTPAMAWGRDTEAEARSAYSFYANVDVVQVGLIKHPDLIGTHCSPDGLVGDDGLVELKCPNSATHLSTLLNGTFAGRYVTQAMWQMAVTGRKYCDLASYDPRFPEDMRLFVRRIERDDATIAEIEAEVRAFLVEVDQTVQRLLAAYRSPSHVEAAG